MIRMDYKIIENKPLSPDYYRMVLEYPRAQETIDPGQFFMVRVGEGYDPLLRRPLSAHRIEKNRLEFLYQVVGKGTKMMTHMLPGRTLSLLGPLGIGFVPPPDTSRSVALVAGGIGIAPFLALAEMVREWAPAAKRLLLYGARNKSHLIQLSAFKKQKFEMHLATEDGSKGHKGYISEVLEELLPSLTKHPPVALYACGPKGLLAKAAELAEKYGAFCQVSLDRRMACGTGVCMGCVVPVRMEDPAGFTYSCVCKEGPVYPYQEIRWDLFAGQEIAEEK